VDALVLIGVVTASTTGAVGIARGILVVMLHVMAHPPTGIRLRSLWLSALLRREGVVSPNHSG